MSLYAVENYVATLLDGLEAPGFGPNMLAQAWVLPPPVTQPAANPQLYVWSGFFDEQRATLSRGPGQKRTQHRLTVFIQWVSSNDPAGSALFPLLIEAVLQPLRAATLSVPIVDPVTGASSVLTDLGEHMAVSYSTPVALNDQRDLQHNAVVRAFAHEWFVA